MEEKEKLELQTYLEEDRRKFFERTNIELGLTKNFQKDKECITSFYMKMRQLGQLYQNSWLREKFSIEQEYRSVQFLISCYKSAGWQVTNDMVYKEE